ncbi:hypothetical protein [Atopobacter phocae]|uniref:hypothetical protein n=1 Tax=Atopobacter phocae TaxID=136492 RepID=UPI0004B7204C|nr:hypothetical protein [Atopobacter phocae]
MKDEITVICLNIGYFDEWNNIDYIETKEDMDDVIRRMNLATLNCTNFMVVEDLDVGERAINVNYVTNIYKDKR